MNRLRLPRKLLAAGLVLACLSGTVHAQEFLGKNAQQWRADLAAKSAATRRSAAFALGKIGKGALDTVSTLTARLGDDDASVREAAAFAIGEICMSAGIGNGDALKALCQHLETDRNPLVRRSAAYAIGCMGKTDDKSVSAALKVALKDNSPAVRQNVAWALGRTGDDTVESLRQALKDSDTLVRRDAAKSVDLLGDRLGPTAASAAVPELVACCQDKTDLELRKAAAIALVRLVSPADNKTAQGPLLELLKKEADPEVRRNVALAIGHIGGPQARDAVPVLLSMLQQGDLLVKRQAALAFKNIGPAAADAVPELRKALHAKDLELRHNAANAFSGFEKAGEPAVPDLLQLLKDRKEELRVRLKAAVALQKIGFNPALVKAIPDLLRLITDPTELGEVRHRAQWPVTRVYQFHLVVDQNKPGDEAVYKALLAILAEPPGKDNKMLRYDCAYVLGMFQQDKTPEKTLDVLAAYLKETEIRVFLGSTGGGQGTGAEGPKDTKTESRDRGEGDGRIMAVLALSAIGAESVNKRRDIVDQLRLLNNQPNLAPGLRAELKKLMAKLK